MWKAQYLNGNLWLIISLISSSLGQVLLRGALRDSGLIGIWHQCVVGETPWLRVTSLFAAGVLIGLGFLAWMQCLTHLPIGYAYSVACFSIVLVHVLAFFLLGEIWSWRAAVGTVMILFGTILIASAPNHGAEVLQQSKSEQ